LFNKKVSKEKLNIKQQPKKYQYGKKNHVIRIIKRHVNSKINAPIKWWIISELNLVVCLHDHIITK
jgi:hypothetical protein